MDSQERRANARVRRVSSCSPAAKTAKKVYRQAVAVGTSSGNVMPMVCAAWLLANQVMSLGAKWRYCLRPVGTALAFLKM